MSKKIWSLSEPRAAVNVAKLFWGDSTEIDLESCNGWRSKDREYQQEFLANAHFIADIEDLGNDQELMALLERPVSTKKPVYLWKWFLAVSMVLLSLGLGLGFLEKPEIEKFTADRYVSTVGEVKHINLTDGSRISMNSGSEILVSMTDSERLIVLRRGEAYFDVSKDSVRPFSVLAGESRVTALGTAFNVRKSNTSLQVIVEQGVVCIHPDSEPVSYTAPLIGGLIGSQESPVQAPALFKVVAGEFVNLDTEKNVISGENHIEVSSHLTWRKGYLEFVRKPLYLVVSEINRYSARKILVEDPEIMMLEVSAVIPITQINQALRNMEAVFPIKVSSYFDHITINSK